MILSARKFKVQFGSSREINNLLSKCNYFVVKKTLLNENTHTTTGILRPCESTLGFLTHKVKNESEGKPTGGMFRFHMSTIVSNDIITVRPLYSMELLLQP